jgi:hypothetical protein
MSQRIFYVYERMDQGEDVFKGYCVAVDVDNAAHYAEKTLGIPREKIRVEDTGKTKPQCCPRR